MFALPAKMRFQGIFQKKSAAIIYYAAGISFYRSKMAKRRYGKVARRYINGCCTL